MSNELDPKMAPTDPAQSTVYEIRLQGHLGRRWGDWFGSVTLTLEDNGQTLLRCPVEDQAALYGLLRKMRNLGLPLVSITRVEPGPAGGSDLKPQIWRSDSERSPRWRKPEPGPE